MEHLKKLEIDVEISARKIKDILPTLSFSKLQAKLSGYYIYYFSGSALEEWKWDNDPTIKEVLLMLGMNDVHVK